MYENLRHYPLELFEQLVRDICFSVPVEEVNDQGRFDDSDGQTSRLTEALTNIYGKSLTGSYPYIRSFSELKEIVTPVLLDELDLYERMVIAQRISGWKYKAIGELWNEVFAVVSSGLPTDRIPSDIETQMARIREELCRILSGLSDGNWLCGLVEHKYADATRQAVTDLSAFNTLYGFYVRPRGVRFERSLDCKDKDYNCPRLRDIPLLRMHLIRGVLSRYQGKNRS
jgi:hypothetical protein